MSIFEDNMNTTHTGGSSAKRKQTIEDLTKEMERVANRTRTRTRTKTEEKDDKYANIESNSFAKIMFDKSLSSDEKKSTLAKALVFEGTKEENAEKIKEFNKFKEYLQFRRQDMADEFMRLADTKSFSELQGVIQDMNAAIIDFDNQMQPLMEILDAVYKLRTAGEGVVLDAFREIQDEKAAELERLQKIEEEATRLEALDKKIKQKRAKIAVKREDRKWFGFGRTKDSALHDISILEQEISADQDSVKSSTETLETLENEVLSPTSNLSADLIASKEKLRELLDLTSDDHIERQQALIDAARHFVNTSQERTNSVLVNLEGMSDRTQNIIDANTKMRSIYAIINEGSKQAADENKKKRDVLKGEASKEGLTMLETMEIEGKLFAIDSHLQELDLTTIDTVKAWNDLNAQGGNILTMKDRNNAQINKTRSLLSSGIGGVADRLVTVLSGISQAALSESSDMMTESISIMDGRTREFQAKEVMQKVLGQQLENERLLDALDDLNAFGQTFQKGTELYKKEVAESFGIVEDARQMAEEIKKIVDEAGAAHSDARDLAENTIENSSGNGEKKNGIEDPFESLNGPK